MFESKFLTSCIVINEKKSIVNSTVERRLSVNHTTLKIKQIWLWIYTFLTHDFWLCDWLKSFALNGMEQPLAQSACPACH